jgi:hypothetical protein
VSGVVSEIEGVIVADLIVPVYADSSVRVTTRPVTRYYGRGGLWIRNSRGGKVIWDALRSDRGWEQSI